MAPRHTRWIGLAASAAALLYGGPAAAALAGLLGSKHLTEFLTECLGSPSSILTPTPDSLQHGIPHVAAHFFCHQLHDFQHSGAHDGLNHDLRRGMVLAIARTLQFQHHSLNHLDGRDESAWSQS